MFAPKLIAIFIVGLGSVGRAEDAKHQKAAISGVVPSTPSAETNPYFACDGTILRQMRQLLINAPRHKLQSGKSMSVSELQKAVPEFQDAFHKARVKKMTFILEGREPSMHIVHMDARESDLRLPDETTISVELRLSASNTTRRVANRCLLMISDPDQSEVATQKPGFSARLGELITKTRGAFTPQAKAPATHECVCSFRFTATSLETRSARVDCESPDSDCVGAFVGNPWKGHGAKVSCGGRAYIEEWLIAIDSSKDHKVSCEKMKKGAR